MRRGRLMAAPNQPFALVAATTSPFVLSVSKDLPPTRVCAAALVALVLTSGTLAQSLGAPAVFSQTIGPVDYAANARVARIVVELDRNGVPADGQSPVRVTLRLFGADGQPVEIGRAHV